jgi:hypothetical protein
MNTTYPIAIPISVFQVFSKLAILAQILLVLAALEAKDKLDNRSDFGLELAANLRTTFGNLTGS